MSSLAAIQTELKEPTPLEKKRRHRKKNKRSKEEPVISITGATEEASSDDEKEEKAPTKELKAPAKKEEEKIATKEKASTKAPAKKEEEKAPAKKELKAPAKKEEVAAKEEKAPIDTRKYWPLEFFLLEVVKDEGLITWIVDQVSILRAVFDLGSWPLNDESSAETITVGGHELNFRSGNSSFFVSCKKATNTEVLRDKERKARAACIHLPEGTAVIFIRQDRQISAYEFNFEESSNWAVLSGSK